jgi:hypothetical protein
MSEDFREDMDAFLNKRSPNFKASERARRSPQQNKSDFGPAEKLSHSRVAGPAMSGIIAISFGSRIEASITLAVA